VDCLVRLRRRLLDLVEFEAFLKLVGSNLRKARWIAGLSQESASADVLTFRLLAALERGEGNPTLRTLWLLSQRYDVAVRDVVETGKEKALKVPLPKAVVEKPPRRRPVTNVPSPRPRSAKKK
jgi:transcriptional regulator with XRE-family HTH domain